MNFLKKRAVTNSNVEITNNAPSSDRNAARVSCSQKKSLGLNNYDRKLQNPISEVDLITINGRG